MLALVVGGLGVTGALYLLLNLWWPGWYLDWYYRRNNLKVGNAILHSLSRGKFLIDIFEEFANLTPQKTFIIYNDEKLSYEYIDRKANQAGRAAIEIGIKPGSVVAIMMYNEPGIVWSYLGFMKVGYQIAFINFNLRAHSLSHSIKASGAKVLIIGEGDGLVEAVMDILPEIPDVAVYVCGKTGEEKPPSFMSFDVVMTRMSTDRIDRSVRKHVLPFSPNVYIYTSGTTGYPKPAIRNARSCVVSGHRYFHGMTKDDILYQTLPQYHSAALLVGFGKVITSGATMVLREKFSARHFWDDCRKHDVTIIQYIGEVCRYLVAQPKSPKDGIHKIKYAFGNGLRQDIWAEFKNRFNIPRVIEFYGATECPIGLSNITNKFGACGRSSPYLRQFTPCAFVKFDLEAQAPLRNKHGFCVPIGTDEIGLMIVPLIEGKTSFQGYRGKKADSEKKLVYDVFTKGDKYFNTGDLMKVDKDYYVYFSDRVGDTFRWKGENVSTTEVSNILTDLDFIHDANVYGVLVPGTDGRAGMAALHLNDQSLATLTPSMITSLSKHVKEVLPTYARPKFIRVQKELIMTSTFKQQKVSLVREGYDVTNVTDPIFYLNPATQSYLPLDYVVFTQIMAGKVPL
ncbi:long-chain fatty acid transport protein 2-like isoform X2 [Ruditapes philippinarum]|uniref:long-chain fatty acid transport protein 2-like isoform X2 n=1 Tax=Ruditapes philippinarum TaxID=129788 RepID=UPI00295BB809|nr:long-chain fatty acid transport protein 2-like isoform X2 [Ruditapes philippinarum]